MFRSVVGRLYSFSKSVKLSAVSFLLRKNLRRLGRSLLRILHTHILIIGHTCAAIFRSQSARVRSFEETIIHIYNIMLAEAINLEVGVVYYNVAAAVFGNRGRGRRGGRDRAAEVF